MLKASWGYLSDKLSIPVSQLNRQNISDELLARGVPQETTDRVIAILDACEMARYTPDSGSDSSVEAVYNDASSVINDLDKFKFSRRK